MIGRWMGTLIVIVGFCGVLWGDLNYMGEREALIEKEQALRFSSTIKLNDQERMVDQYLKSMVQLERQAHPSSKKDLLQLLDQDTSFYQSPLMHFLQSMPKGGVLHVHSSAMGSLPWLLEQASEDKNCYVYLGEDQGKWIKGAFHFFKEAPSTSWKRVVDLRKSYTSNEEFQHELHQLLTLSHKDVSGEEDVWERFENCFKRVSGIIKYGPLREEYLKHVFQEYLDQNVQYLEVRAGLSHVYDLSGKEYNDNDALQLYDDAIRSVQKIDPSFSMRIIHAASRAESIESMRESLGRFTRIKALFPTLIVGFDIVNEEDRSHNQLFYMEELKSFQKENPELDFAYFFHAGESNERDNHNVLDSILLGTRRIGHGLTLAKHPHLMQVVKDKEIAIEICPISNQALGYVGELKNHPAEILMSFGVPVVLSPDDPAMMRYPFTCDFFEACVHWDLDLRDLKQLSKNSLLYSALPKEEKEKMLTAWETKWDAFILSVLKEENFKSKLQNQRA